MATNLIPNNWTVEQALAVYELFAELNDAIFERYGDALAQRFAQQCCDEQLLEAHLDAEKTWQYDEDDGCIPF